MKKPVILILTVLMAISFSACGGKSQSGDTNPGTEVTTPNDTPSTDSTPEPVEPIVVEPTEKTLDITFNGRVDMNFIEVTFDNGEYGIMQLSDALKESFDSLGIAEGSVVSVTYIEKDGQKVITGIDQ